MKHVAAVKALKALNKVRRSKWPKGNYLVLELFKRKRFLMRWSERQQEFEPATFYWDEIMAVDWEIVA